MMALGNGNSVEPVRQVPAHVAEAKVFKLGYPVGVHQLIHGDEKLRPEATSVQGKDRVPEPPEVLNEGGPGVPIRYLHSAVPSLQGPARLPTYEVDHDHSSCCITILLICFSSWLLIFLGLLFSSSFFYLVALFHRVTRRPQLPPTTKALNRRAAAP